MIKVREATHSDFAPLRSQNRCVIKFRLMYILRNLKLVKTVPVEPKEKIFMSDRVSSLPEALS